MAEVVNAYAVEPGTGAQMQPWRVDVGEMAARLLARDHPWIVRKPGNVSQNARDGRRQRHHARSRLRIAQAQLPGRAVDIVPAQLQDFVAPASGQHQQPDRRRHMGPDRAFGFHFVQRPAQAPELRIREEPLARARSVPAHRPAGVLADLAKAPVLGQRHHLRHDLQHRIRRVGLAAHLVVQLRGMLGRDLPDEHGSECRKNVIVERRPVDLGPRRRHPCPRPREHRRRAW